MVEIDINTDIVPESKCILDYIERRLNKRLGNIILFTGGTGTGKSFSGIRLLELWYGRYFKEPFPVDHICDTLEEAVLIVKDFKRPGEGILIEELSILAGVRESLTNQNKLWNKFLDTCRIKRAIILGNVPHLSFIDKHFIMMANAWINCEGVDFEKGIVIAKPLWFQTAPHKAEPYRHRFTDEEGFPIDLCYFRKPSDVLLDKYNKMKDINVEDLYSEIAFKMKNDRISRLKKMGERALPKREMQAYELWLSGVDNEEGAQNMGLKEIKDFQKYVKRAQERLKDPKFAYFLREMEKTSQKNKNSSESEEKPALINLSQDKETDPDLIFDIESKYQDEIDGEQ